MSSLIVVDSSAFIEYYRPSAASAIQAGAVVYHVDGHFDSIAQHSDLTARHLLPKDSEE